MTCSHCCQPIFSTTSVANKVADRDGKIVFRWVNFDLTGDYNLLSYPQSTFCAARMEMGKNERNVTLILSRGNRLEGKVIDKSTGRALANRTVEIRGNYKKAIYNWTIKTTTDGRGCFVFENLEAAQYQVKVQKHQNSEIAIDIPLSAGTPPLELHVE